MVHAGAKACTKHRAWRLLLSLIKLASSTSRVRRRAAQTDAGRRGPPDHVRLPRRQKTVWQPVDGRAAGCCGQRRARAGRTGAAARAYMQSRPISEAC
eukprot:359804-Chlamydomonas_euryale.AAC.6